MKDWNNHTHITKMTKSTAVIAPVLRTDVPFATSTNGQLTLLLAFAQDLLSLAFFHILVHAPQSRTFLSPNILTFRKSCTQETSCAPSHYADQTHTDRSR